MPEDLTASEFTRLLDYLKTSRGFDFGAYKVSSLMRRIQKRMREVGLQGYAEYIEFLEVHPHEFGPLFDTVLINVTGFFRDAPSWSCLAEKILPRILESQDPERPLRQDLCHRRRRGRAGHRTPGELRGAPDRRSASGAARQVFRDERHPLRLPRRPCGGA